MDEVSKDTDARYCQSCFRSGRIVLPLEGKGDRSAVDEVICEPAPLRGASKNAPDTRSLVATKNCRGCPHPRQLQFEYYFANSYIAMAQITQWVMKSSTVQFSFAWCIVEMVPGNSPPKPTNF